MGPATVIRALFARDELGAFQSSVHVWILSIAYRCGSELLARHGDPGRSTTRPPICTPHRDDGTLDPRPQDLHEMLSTLPPTERALVHLVYSRHSQQEVADILGMSRAVVNVYLASSMVTLHPWLAARAVNASPLAVTAENSGELEEKATQGQR